MKKQVKNDKNHIWYYLVNFWTIFFIFVVIFDFVTNNALGEFMDISSFVYVGALAVYAGNKEFERWSKKHFGKHPGELYVIVWTIIIFTILILDFLFDKTYEMPSCVISSYIAVLTILAITEQSKSLYKKKSKK